MSVDFNEPFGLSPSIEAARSHSRDQYLRCLTQIRRYNPDAQIREVQAMLHRLAIMIPEWPNARSLAAQSLQSTTKDSPDLQIPNLSAFLQSLGQPPAPLVRDLLPDRALVLLTGKPKYGKSLVALDIQHALCQGKPVFGAFPCARTGPVLYLGMEDSPFEIASRLKARSMANSSSLYVNCERLALSEPAVIGQLSRWLEQVKPVLVVVDTAREACGIRDWSNPAEVTDKIRPLRQLARDYCTILLVTHNRKTDGAHGDEIAGCNALTSSVDGWISIHRKETRPNGDLLLQARVEGRGAMQGSLNLLMDPKTLHFRIAPPEEPEDSLSAEFRDVIDAIEVANGRATIEEIALVTGTSEKVARRAVQQMLLARLIHAPGKRQTTGRSTALYAITEAGEIARKADDARKALDQQGSAMA